MAQPGDTEDDFPENNPSRTDALRKNLAKARNAMGNLRAEQLRDSSSESTDRFTGMEGRDPGVPDRFTYQPNTFVERLTAGTVLKSKLRTSQNVRIPYRRWCKYALIVFLVVFGALFTPQLLPRWLGFEWASTSDLCQDKEEKLAKVQDTLEELVELPIKRADYARHQTEVRCMDMSAAVFYNRIGQVLWPNECTVERAGASIETQICIGPTKVSSCSKLRGLKKLLGGLSGACKTKTTPRKCTTAVDGSRAQALLALQREEEAEEAVAEVEAETQTIVNTANEQGKEIVSALLVQVDIASDMYILYKVVALIIGMPLTVYKREKGSRILGATLGMQKITFIVIVVIALTVYEPAVALLKQTDLPRLFRNFQNDPCYVDVDFSQRRVELILNTCSEVSQLSANASIAVQDMDDIYYLTKRFALCHRPNPRTHPLESTMDTVRERFRDGDLSFDGSCNATMLDELTSVAPDNPNISKFRALMGSGVIAQLLLKIVISSFVVHLLAYLEPMITHSGKVELWDLRPGATQKHDGDGRAQLDPNVAALNKREEIAVVRYARDRNLLPLLIASVFLVFEVVLIIYSIVVATVDVEDLKEIPSAPTPPMNFDCLTA